ncbi:hypothetical protein XENOCAPTIV_005059, partial [Xenoophorus captivus]
VRSSLKFSSGSGYLQCISQLKIFFKCNTDTCEILHVFPPSSTFFVCVKAFADSVSSQKRAAADGECREESLLQETATKEAAMATRLEEVQTELKQARLALGNAHEEIDRLGGLSTHLKKVWYVLTK